MKNLLTTSIFLLSIITAFAQCEIIFTNNICEDSAPILLTGVPSGGVFSGPGVTGNYFDPSVAGAGNTTINYFESGCSVDSVITVIPLPTSTFSVLSICQDDTSTITYLGNASPSATYVWDFPGGTIISGVPGQGPCLVSWATSGTFTCSLTVTENGCSSTYYSDLIIVPYGSPNCCSLPIPDAGIDNNICGACYTLQANPSWGLGTWTSNAPGIATFTDIHDPNTDVCVNTYGVHTFTWEENNGVSCVASDDVAITFIEPPLADAGPDQSVCGYNATIYGSFSSGYTGSWSSIPSALTFSPPNSPITNVVASSIGLWTCIWTEENNGCFDSDTLMVEFGFDSYINGNISYNSSNMSTGDAEVELYQINSGTYSLYSNSSIDGSDLYNFNNPSAGDYMLKAKVLNQSTYPDAMDTYYNGEYLWDNAQVLNLACGDSLNINIDLVQTTTFTPGNGSVSGFITEESSGNPVTDAVFFLEDTLINHPSLYTPADINGYYEFDDLPIASYNIIVDLPGIPQITTHNFSVTAIDTLFENYDYYVDTVLFRETGIGIYADETNIQNIDNAIEISHVTVYPNPFNKQFNLAYDLDNNSNVEIQLIDINGRVIFSDRMQEQNAGNHSRLIEIADKGVYFLILSIDNKTYIKKLISE